MSEVELVPCPRCLRDPACVLCTRDGKSSRMVPQALAVEYSFTPPPDHIKDWPGWLMKLRAMRERHDYE